MITIPSLNNVTDILDTDMIMVTQQSGQSYKIAGSELNKRGKIIIANGTTITGAPIKAGSSVRVYFTVDLTAANASTTLQLNYNNVNYYVKAPKDGTLINFVATNLGGSPAVYKYLQKYTTLELLFDGTQFVIIGNPVILSSADYTIYADGQTVLVPIGSVISGNNHPVTSGGVNTAISKFKNIMAGTVEFPNAEIGVQEVTVTFSTPLPNAPLAIMIEWMDSANTFTYVSYVMIKSNSATKDGFVAMTKRLQQNASWFARYVVIY